MALGRTKLENELPALQLKDIILCVLALLALRMIIHKTVMSIFAIHRERAEHSISTLEYSSYYLLSIVVLLHPEMHWNLFDFTLWIFSYICVGMLRKQIYVINKEKEILLNVYSYDQNIMPLLASCKLFSCVLFVFSILLAMAVVSIFQDISGRTVGILLFPTIMLAVDSFFLYLESNSTTQHLLCFFNQNINQIPPLYKINIWNRFISSAIKLWNYQTLAKIFMASFIQTFDFFDCMWSFSLLQALYIAGSSFIRSIRDYHTYSKLMNKMNKIFMVVGSKPDQVCIICLEKLLNCRQLTECGHTFHYRCMFQWIQTKKECPVCRMKINMNL